MYQINAVIALNNYPQFEPYKTYAPKFIISSTCSCKSKPISIRILLLASFDIRRHAGTDFKSPSNLTLQGASCYL